MVEAMLTVARRMGAELECDACGVEGWIPPGENA